MPSAIGVGSLVHSAGRLAGTAFAGVAVGFLGTAAAYAANGLSFLFVASVVPFLRPAAGAVTVAGSKGPTSGQKARTGKRVRIGKKAQGLPDTVPFIPAQRGSEPAREDLTVRQGLVFFLRRPRLVALAGITGVSAVFGRNYGLTLAVLVTGPLAGGAGEFGTVSTVLAVGGIVGAVLGARLRRPSERLVGAFAATGGLLQAVAGLSPSLAVLLVLVLPMAVVESVSDTAGTTVLQTDPPAQLRGRVLGVWGSISTGWGAGRAARAGPAHGVGGSARRPDRRRPGHRRFDRGGVPAAGAQDARAGHRAHRGARRSGAARALHGGLTPQPLVAVGTG